MWQDKRSIYESHSSAFEHIVRFSPLVYLPETESSEKYKVIMEKKK